MIHLFSRHVNKLLYMYVYVVCMLCQIVCGCLCVVVFCNRVNVCLHTRKGPWLVNKIFYSILFYSLPSVCDSLHSSHGSGREVTQTLLAVLKPRICLQ